MRIDFDAVRSRLDIERVAEWLGIELRHSKSVCPFHPERTPSFSIDRKRQIYKCFSCDAGGNAITLTAKVKGISNGEAAKLLNAEFNLGFDFEYIRRQPRSLDQVRRTQEREQRKMFEMWHKQITLQAVKLLRRLDDWKIKCRPIANLESPDERFVFALHELTLLNSIIDELFKQDEFDRPCESEYFSGTDITQCIQDLGKRAKQLKDNYA